MKTAFALLAFVLALFLNLEVSAQTEDPPVEENPLPERIIGEPMTIERLEAIISILDPAAERIGNAFTFQIEAGEAGAVAVNIITDPAADRMRIVVGLFSENLLTPDLMKRVMQANFDTALDARYAIAQGYLWSSYIHPLSPLADEEFLSGLGQTVTLALTFGTTYSSGVLVFGGGDSQGIFEDLMEEYRKKLEPEV